jgi:hypothetical protein
LSADWKALTREAGLRPDGASIRVPCGSDRFHVVNVADDEPHAIRIWSRVVTGGNAPDGAALQAWKMNRFRELVGFKEEERGRIIGEAWIPRAGLTSDEWRVHVLTLARACDRLEYLWTGRDVE